MPPSFLSAKNILNLFLKIGILFTLFFLTVYERVIFYSLLCFRDCCIAPIAGVLCGTMSIVKTPALSFFTAPATMPETKFVRQGIIYELIFWKKP